jgi:RNA polymerase sigma-70 factor (ECF subfamily)
MVEMTDPFEEVLVAAQAGDEYAFGCLWRELNPRLTRYLRTLARGSASDLASETWLQVIRHLADFEGDESAFRGWVFTIARRKLVDEQRRESRRPKTMPDDETLANLAAPDDTAVLALDNLTTDAALRLIATLPPDQAEVILLRVVAGLDANAVATIVGKSAGAVRVSAHRGLRRLQELVPQPVTAGSLL